MKKIQTIRGTHDILPEAMRTHHFVVETARRVASSFGFDSMQTPIFESTEVFSRPLGETSDVVTKEMYTFEDRGGDSLTLRPEGTAGVVRAFIQNGLAQSTPFKVFYDGAMFRYERPQKGRQRQFHQFGVEVLGQNHPHSDVEIISMGYKILQELGVDKDIVLHINTLGDKESRDNYRTALVNYLSDYKSELSEESQVRLEKNPLRILDSKNPDDQRILENANDAPVFYDYLNPESLAYFNNVIAGLKLLKIPYFKNPKLVRGFDYYCHTAFEFITETIGSQGTILGGGRYDGLCKMMGGSATAGIGFAAGIERLTMMIENTNPVPPPRSVIIISLDSDGENICQNKSLEIANTLRNSNIRCEMTYTGNMKKRFKFANKIGAKIAVIIGSNELKNGGAIVRDFDNGYQQEIPFDDINKHIQGIL